jgi:hypothetical protein
VVVRIRPGQVKLDTGQPLLYVTDRTGPVIRDLDRRMTKVQFGARRRVRVRSGLLLSTIRKQPGFSRAQVYVDLIAGKDARTTPYTGVEEFGSAPHEIAVRRRKALRFIVHGRVVFRTRVRHPGTTGSHFLTESLILAAD